MENLNLYTWMFFLIILRLLYYNRAGNNCWSVEIVWQDMSDQFHNVCNIQTFTLNHAKKRSVFDLYSWNNRW